MIIIIIHKNKDNSGISNDRSCSNIIIVLFLLDRIVFSLQKPFIQNNIIPMSNHTQQLT